MQLTAYPAAYRAGNSTVISAIFKLLFILTLLLQVLVLNAQDVLVGLTSNGGPEGRGTAFSIKTSGASFSLIKGFADWGKTPWGNLLLGSDGNFYGMTSLGGTNNAGTIFKATPTGVITVLHHFIYATEGANPYGELIKGADGNYYGLTNVGGANSYGTVFKITSSGTFSIVHALTHTDGTNPRGHLVIGSDGNFYGCTYSGGTNGYGTIFKMTTSGTVTVLHSLSSAADGANCYGSLIKGTDNNFYGITNGGGTFGQGTIFKITPAGTYTVLRHMNSADGVHSQSDLIQATDGNFYGMAYSGGASFLGTIFKISSTGTFTVLRSLVSANGSNPYGGLLQGSDGNFYGQTSGGGASSGGTVFKITPTGTLTVLHSLVSTTEGGSARGSLVKGADGNYYGLTNSGGSNFFGTLFKITPTGTFTTLTKFNGASIGNAPLESLLKGKDSAYYGTTSSGGVYNYGTIFKICAGTVTVLHSFNRNVDGGTPKGSLMQATNNYLYGTTTEGGTNSVGTIFKITTGGTFTVVRNLSSTTDGGSPQGSLMQASDGNLYGLNKTGGTNGAGTIFKLTTGGTYSVLHHFSSSTEGAAPEGNLVQGTDGALYGMTFSSARIFKITTAGVFTALHTLTATEGSFPSGGLVKASDGKFYGTTSGGGTNNAGTIFNVTTTGTVTVLKVLSATTGSVPKGNLVIGTDKNFYGLTSAGGTNNAGTLFKITSTGTYTVLKNFNLTTDGGAAFGSLVLAPVNGLVANAQSATTAEDVSKAITLTGTGSSSLIYTISTQPKNGTVSGTGANRTYKSNANYNGKDSFYFTVGVGCLASTPAKVNITITSVNDAPVLAAIGNKAVVINTTLSFTAKATDVDAGQTKTFSLITPPSGATIVATTGVFTWKPTVAGSYTFKVRVTDNGSPVLFDEEQITVTVTASLAVSVTSTSINQSGKVVSLFDAHIYPNPVTDKVHLLLGAGIPEARITITDAAGVVVYSKNYSGLATTQLNLSTAALKIGVYMLVIQTRDGNKVLRFVKLN